MASYDSYLELSSDGGAKDLADTEGFKMRQGTGFLVQYCAFKNKPNKS